MYAIATGCRSLLSGRNRTGYGYSYSSRQIPSAGISLAITAHLSRFSLRFLAPVPGYVKAPMPVMARPTMSVCMVSVPSKV
jgi:hypothetical protein